MKSNGSIIETKKQYLPCNTQTQPTEEITSTFLTVLPEDDRLNPICFLNWTRLVRVAAYVLRFVSNCRLPAKDRITKALDPEETKKAEIYFIQQAQLENFFEEISSLKAGKSLPSTSKLLPLSPCVDEDGIIRCNSRLQFANCLSWESRFPIILPRKSQITSLIIRDAHNQCKHGGTNQVLIQLSTKYWIISAREAIGELERDCST